MFFSVFYVSNVDVLFENFQGSSLVLTCKLSQLWKQHCRQRQRYLDYLRDEALQKLALADYHVSLSIGDHQKNSRIPRTIRSKPLEKVGEDKEDIDDALGYDFLKHNKRDDTASSRELNTTWLGSFSCPLLRVTRQSPLQEKLTSQHHDVIAKNKVGKLRVKFEESVDSAKTDEDAEASHDDDVYDSCFAQLQQTYTQLVDDYDSERKRLDAESTSPQDSHKNCCFSSETIFDVRQAKFEEGVASQLANNIEAVRDAY